MGEGGSWGTSFVHFHIWIVPDEGSARQPILTTGAYRLDDGLNTLFRNGRPPWCVIRGIEVVPTTERHMRNRHTTLSNMTNTWVARYGLLWVDDCAKFLP